MSIIPFNANGKNIVRRWNLALSFVPLLFNFSECNILFLDSVLHYSIFILV